MLMWPDEILARFDYLASDFGFFDSGSRAVDHCLRGHDLVSIMVVQYLDAIAANARLGMGKLHDSAMTPTDINENSTRNLRQREPKCSCRW